MIIQFKSDHQVRIEKFMKLIAGQELPQSPEVPPIGIRQLRAALILEETFETIDALGFKVNAIPVKFNNVNNDHRFECPDCDGDLYCYGCEKPVKIIPAEQIKYELEAKEDQNNISLVDIVDGCADISVVTIGTLSACGVSDEPIMREVDDNNLTKFGPGQYIRDDGKLVKPPNHKPPRIAETLQILKDKASE